MDSNHFHRCTARVYAASEPTEVETTQRTKVGSRSLLQISCTYVGFFLGKKNRSVAEIQDIETRK